MEVSVLLDGFRWIVSNLYQYNWHHSSIILPLHIISVMFAHFHSFADISTYLCNHLLLPLRKLKLLGRNCISLNIFVLKVNCTNTHTQNHSGICILLKGLSLLPVPPLVFLVQSILIAFKTFFSPNIYEYLLLYSRLIKLSWWDT